MSEPNTRDLEYQISTMVAAANGAKIERRSRYRGDDWSPVRDPRWDWVTFEYRVAPEPKTFWIVDCVPKPGQAKFVERESIARSTRAAGVEAFNYFVDLNKDCAYDIALYEVVVKEKLK